MINYLHRIVLGIAAPAIAQDFQIDETMMGVVFAAFSWTYAMAQIPGGACLDRFGTKFTYFISVTIWSLFTTLHASAVGLKSLLFYRFGLGLAQAPCFPANARILSAWFPRHERARATAIFTVGEFISIACFSPLLFWILIEMGWRSLFFIVGVAGLLFSILWHRVYSDPCPVISEVKTEDHGLHLEKKISSQNYSTKPFSRAEVLKLLQCRQVLGMSLGGFSGNTVLIFFLTWFPTYLATEHHMEWIQTGFFAIFPFLAAAVGVMVGGSLSDYLLARNKPANVARKLPILLGLLLASNIMWANYTENNSLVIVILSIAFFGQGMSALGWTLVADIAPRNLVGLTGGICNFSSNIAGIATPIVIGVIFSKTGSFHYALMYVSIMAILGLCSYLFIIGDIKRVELGSHAEQ
nr:MFS transporter [Pelobacter seleniigenes]